MTEHDINVERDGWTIRAVDRLRELVLEGRSGSRIALALGATRNSVIGKVHRLGLSLKGVQPSANYRTIVRRVKKLEGAAMTKPKLGKPRKTPYLIGHLAPSQRPAPKPIETIAAPTAQDCPPKAGRLGVYDAIAALEDRHCRWPIGNPTKTDETFHFCCAPRVDVTSWRQPYCAFHRSRVGKVAEAVAT